MCMLYQFQKGTGKDKKKCLDPRAFYIENAEFRGNILSNVIKKKNSDYYERLTYILRVFSNYSIDKLLQFETFDKAHEIIFNHQYRPLESRHNDENMFQLYMERFRFNPLFEGLKELIGKLNQNYNTHRIEIFNSNTRERHVLFCKLVQPLKYYTGNNYTQSVQFTRWSMGQDKGELFKRSEDSVSKIVYEPFSMGWKRGSVVLTVHTLQKASEKLKATKNILNSLNHAIKSEKGRDNLIMAVGRASRELSQVRLYGKCHGILMFLYSNLLLNKLGESFFYPRLERSHHMFDYLSDEELLMVIKDGQKIFQDLFKSTNRILWFVEEKDNPFNRLKK